ncbi:fucolectin tachylectin-4 pentraxin-1 [Acetobacter pomorum DSM 11825]|nr:fucolectin tachylectin-4 pentraxin-1 [Acetobacter pomorum DSM 11825]
MAGVMQRNLIIARCGAQSLHPEWRKGGAPDWDLVLCPFQPIEMQGLPGQMVVGHKWDGLYRFLTEWDGWQQYDYICLPDDDLFATAETWNRFFAACGQYKAKLAAPALTPGSFCSHLSTLQNKNFVARASTFAEIMAPCMHRDFLQQVLPTLRFSRAGTGFGLDLLWPMMLGWRDIWIMDATPVEHTRPVGQQRSSALGEMSEYDFRFIAGLGVVGATWPYGGYTPQGTYLDYQDKRFAEVYRQGYAYVQQQYPQYWAEVCAFQASAPPQVSAQALRKLEHALFHLNKDTGTLLSRHRPARVSSVSQWSWSQDAVREASGGNDGLINGGYGFHTDFEDNPWWQVDLGQMCAVHEVVLYNRLDQKECCVQLNILVSEAGTYWQTVFAKQDEAFFGGADSEPLQVMLPTPVMARFVRVQAVGHTVLHLDQVEVMGSPAGAAAQKGVFQKAIYKTARFLNALRG